MKAVSVDLLARAYFAAKSTVISAGFEPEVEEARRRVGETPNETDFLRESAWVILCSGMRTEVVAQKFEAITAAFLDWESASRIALARQACIEEAVKVFGHLAKLTAIADVADHLSACGVDELLGAGKSDPILSLRRLPFIGPITSFHLAKNLGFDTGKPDRHLATIARASGWTDAVSLCRVVAVRICEPAAVVDSVLWRYATLVRSPESEWWVLLDRAAKEEARPQAGLSA